MKRIFHRSIAGLAVVSILYPKTGRCADEAPPPPRMSPVPTPAPAALPPESKTPEPAPRPTSIFSSEYGLRTLGTMRDVVCAPVDWDRDDWLIAGGAVGVTAGLFAADPYIRDAFQRNRSKPLDDSAKWIQKLGQEGSYVILGGFMVGGEVFGDPRAEAVAQDAIPAMILASGIVTPVLKYSVGRERPEEDHGAYSFRPFSGRASFPSGHTTQAFVLASVISENYKSPWVSIPAYTLATAVGLSRMEQNAHHASDVFAGAVIGTAIGIACHRFNGPARDDVDRHITWSPWFDGEHTGVALNIRF